jgi:Ca2+-binding RTX toxin-like protein
VSGTGNVLDNQILGNTSANTLDGGAGNDHLDGRAGSDTLIGGLGNDRLDGGTGDDILEGGLGNDTYVVDSKNDTINEFIGGGIDTVLSDVDFDLGFGLNGNVENLTLTGAGTSGIGNGLDNVITGTSAGNSLQGGEGHDTLYGRDGNDVLVGGLGNDILEGGLGVDTMRGDTVGIGGGSDLFLYRLDTVGDLFNLGGDFIVGFETGIDKIDVSDLLQDFNIDSVFTNPYDPSDRFLSLVANGADTLIFFAPNGGAGMGATLLATVVNATVTEADVIC